jgi:hypothetical protein
MHGRISQTMSILILSVLLVQCRAMKICVQKIKWTLGFGYDLGNVTADILHVTWVAKYCKNVIT